MKQICVIDGQGGGIGSAIIKYLKAAFGEGIEIVAIGTNAIATSQMLRAKANRGASGENAIIQTVPKVDFILGPLGIILSHAMMGEITPPMTEAICASRAPKILLPLTQENVEIVGTPQAPLPHLIEALVEKHLSPLLNPK